MDARMTQLVLKAIAFHLLIFKKSNLERAFHNVTNKLKN
jgi:hypothetical protein